MLKTLLVDGNAILQIGFHGIKNFYHKEKHVGALFHFINTLKRNLVENKYGKVVVFWDSSTSTDIRKELYPFYKANRKKRFSEEDWDSFLSQKNRVCEYLEELFVRQIEIDCLFLHLKLYLPITIWAAFKSGFYITEMIVYKTLSL